MGIMLLLPELAGKEAFSLPAQSDSLLQAIKEEKDRKAKADLLMQAGELLIETDADEAIRFFLEANALYARDGFPEGVADSWYKCILVYREKQEWDSAQAYAQKFFDLGRTMGDSLRMAKGYYQFGNVLAEKDFIEASIQQYRRGLALFSAQEFSLGIFASYNALGNMYKAISEFDSSAAFYLKAVDHCEQAGDERNLATILTNLGDVYLQSVQLDVAGKYYHQAFEINAKYPDRAPKLAAGYNDLGRLAAAAERYDSALIYYEKAKELYMAQGDSLGVLFIYTNLGDLYFNQDNMEQAILHSGIALEGYQKMGYLKGTVIAYGNLAAAFAESGDYRKAAVMHDSCLRLVRRLGNKDLLIDSYTNLADTYKNLGMYDKAFAFQELRYELKDSVFNLSKTRMINDLLLKYEKEHDQAQILALESENLKKTIQRNGVIYGSAGLLFLMVFGFIIAWQRIRHHKLMAQEKIQRLEEERKLMTAKMLLEGQEEERKRIARELHDGLGVLLSATKMQFTTIKNISPENGHIIDKATQLLEQATGDVRKISHNMMPGLLTKLGLYEAVEDLFENLNDADNIHAAFEITGDDIRLPENKEIMLYRVIQEMVNNTLKHAEASEIKLIINVIPDRMDLIYYDNGKGFNMEEIFRAESDSLGLKSIRSRIGFLNGKVDIDSRPGRGTRFAIEIPVG